MAHSAYAITQVEKSILKKKTDNQSNILCYWYLVKKY